MPENFNNVISELSKSNEGNQINEYGLNNEPLFSSTIAF